MNLNPINFSPKTEYPIVSPVSTATPVLFKEAARKKSILDNTPAVIKVAENPSANTAATFVEKPEEAQVHRYDHLIVKEARQQGVEPNLVRAVMHMETTHGWYDSYALGWNKSILPMNVHHEYWSGLGYSKADLKNPQINIHVGVLLIKRISERVQNPTVEKIATLYNALAKDVVSDYGARVGKIYHDKLWQNAPK